MSTSSARINAKRAQRATTIEEKLDSLAKAIYALASALDDVDTAIKRLKTPSALI
jgi:uncharacterized membrane protein